MHNMTGFLGAAVGVAIAVVIWVVVVSLRKERSGDAPQFDERQLAARARAYSSAFFTLLGYLAVVALLDSVAEVRWCDLYTACFLGMMLALDVFAVAAIRSDAYFGIHERPVASIVLFAFVAVLNLGVAIARFAAGEPLLENGLLTRTSSMNLILGIAFVPDFCIPKDDPDLFILELTESLPTRQMVVAYNESLPVSQAARQFMELL